MGGSAARQGPARTGRDARRTGTARRSPRVGAATCSDGTCAYTGDGRTCSAAERCTRRGCVAGPADAGPDASCVPMAETCNGIDDDCDARIDEDAPGCTVCDPGRGDCDGDGSNGCEADFSSASTCGSCALRCEGATPLCIRDGADARCESRCPAGTPTMCGDSCVDITTDLAHCGGCDRPCGAPHRPGTCAGAACTSGACDEGFDDCDGEEANGVRDIVGDRDRLRGVRSRLRRGRRVRGEPRARAWTGAAATRSRTRPRHAAPRPAPATWRRPARGARPAAPRRADARASRAAGRAAGRGSTGRSGDLPDVHDDEPDLRPRLFDGELHRRGLRQRLDAHLHARRHDQPPRERQRRGSPSRARARGWAMSTRSPPAARGSPSRTALESPPSSP